MWSGHQELRSCRLCVHCRTQATYRILGVRGDWPRRCWPNRIAYGLRFPVCDDSRYADNHLSVPRFECILRNHKEIWESIERKRKHVLTLTRAGPVSAGATSFALALGNGAEIATEEKMARRRSIDCDRVCILEEWLAVDRSWFFLLFWLKLVANVFVVFVIWQVGRVIYILRKFVHGPGELRHQRLGPLPNVSIFPSGSIL